MTTRRPAAALVCAAIAALALIATYDPATTWWFPSCPFRALTGWLCPFCGSLRALHALLRGEPLVAWTLNPLAVVCLAAGLVALAHDEVRPARITQVERLTGLWFSARGFALVALFGIARNVPVTFSWIH